MGFQTTKIHPINRNVFTDEDFLAVGHAEEPTIEENRNDQYKLAGQGSQPSIQQPTTTKRLCWFQNQS